MEQLNIFDTDHKPERKTGFRNRWHIRKGNKHVALAIPHQHEVTILPGKYQDVIPYDSFEVSYEQYEAWLKENKFEERPIK
ncbi:hypothetical protein [Salinicoccus sp. HZC-1]|uniref:hypothetical protein n=1 Tax=Salinicoccus sp. HZC-1 TaxID=3385497 RepID=UPI00398A84A8